MATGFFAYNWAIAGRTLYWVNDWEYADTRACVLPDCASGPTLAGAGMFGYDALVADPAGQNLFWEARTDETGSLASIKIQTMNLATKVIRTLVTGRRTYSLAADASFLYFTDGVTQTVEKVPVTGGAPIVLAYTMVLSPQSPAPVLAVCGSRLYWAAAPDGSVYFAPLPNGIGAATAPIFASTGQPITALACDDSGIYWANTGSIGMCPHAGCAGPPRILAPAQALPWDMAIDAEAVYWVNFRTPGSPASGGGGVYKVAK